MVLVKHSINIDNKCTTSYNYKQRLRDFSKVFAREKNYRWKFEGFVHSQTSLICLIIFYLWNDKLLYISTVKFTAHFIKFAHRMCIPTKTTGLEHHEVFGRKYNKEKEIKLCISHWLSYTWQQYGNRVAFEVVLVPA